jgi:hypothetical protein
MKNNTVKALVTSLICLCIVSISGIDVFSQQKGSSGTARAEEEGKFEITTKNQPETTIRVDSLGLDRNLDRILDDRRIMIKYGWTESQLKEWKRTSGRGQENQEERRFYRVEPEGYLGFKESEWVNKLSFRALNKLMTESPEYKKYAELLSEITRTIFKFEKTLRTYDQSGLRLINTCNESQFKSLQAVDARIREQLNAYGLLQKLREDVLGLLQAFAETDACKDLVLDYQANLKQSVKELVELSEKNPGIENKVSKMLEQARDVKGQSQGRPNTGH